MSLYPVADYRPTRNDPPLIVRVLRVRHETPPTPKGCRWCGIPKRGHSKQWLPKRIHGWEHPTEEQIAARKRARLTPRPGQASTAA